MLDALSSRKVTPIMVLIWGLVQGGFVWAFKDQSGRLDRALADAAENRTRVEAAVGALAEAKSLIEGRGSCICPACPRPPPCPGLKCPSCPTLTCAACPPQAACSSGPQQPSTREWGRTKSEREK